MRILLSLLILLSASPAYAGYTTVETWCQRFYRIYTPTNVSGSAPVIFVLHPGYSNAELFQSQLGLDAYAEKMGAYVVYPYGTGFVYGQPPTLYETWNASDNCCGLSSSTHQDDMRAVHGIVQHILQTRGIDFSHIYFAGYSNGAEMWNRYLCTYGSDTVQINGSPVTFSPHAVSIFAGCLLVDFNECTGAIPAIPYQAFYSANDIIIPPAGRTGASLAIQFPSITAWTDKMALQGADVTVTQINATGCPVDRTGHCFTGINAGLNALNGSSMASTIAAMIPFVFYKTSADEFYVTSDGNYYKVREN